MSQKQEVKAREFWLAQDHEGNYDAFEKPCSDYSNYKGALEVVDKSTFESAAKAFGKFAMHHMNCHWYIRHFDHDCHCGFVKARDAIKAVFDYTNKEALAGGQDDSKD